MLEAKRVHKLFDNGKEKLAVLKGVDLSIEKGRFVALVGPSGAGKSTLLNILGGLDYPSQGEVLLEEENIHALGDTALSSLRNKKIGFVFQFYHLLPEFTVLENVLMPALIGKDTSRKARLRLKGSAVELLDQVGLAQRMEYFPDKLSGGEKQRVAIVRGLVNKPGLLLCDEPTGNLDSKSSSDVITLLKRINMENHMTIVLVTHII
jgi:lipoprotein-releasing system ATP-binding protein